MTEQEIKDKIAQIDRNIYCMECGDDFLMTNGNGNRDRYNDMVKERNELSQKLHG